MNILFIKKFKKILINRTLTSGFISNLGSMVLISVLNIIFYRIALEYFGKEIFGIYALLATFTGYIILANFGIPTTVTILLSENINKSKQKYIINHSFILLILLAIFLLSSLYFIDFSYLADILGVNSENSGIFSYCIIFSLIGISLKLPFQLYQSIFLGNQKIGITRLFDISLAGSLCLMLYFSIAFKIDFTNFYQIYTILTIIITIIGFFIAYKEYAYTSIISLHNNKSKIYKLSFGFFLLSLPVTFGWTIDNLIISSYLGVVNIASYTFSTKIYMLALALVSVLPNTLFSFYMRQKAINGFSYALKLHAYSLTVLRLMTGIIVLMIFAIDDLVIKLWSNSENVYAGVNFSLTMCFYVYVTALVNLHSSFLTGTLNVKKVTFLSYAELIMHIFLSILLINIFGLVGIALAMLISSLFVPYVLLPKIIDQNSSTPFLYENLKHLCISFLPSLLLIYTARILIADFNFKFLVISIVLPYFTISTILSNKKNFTELLALIKNRKIP